MIHLVNQQNSQNAKMLKFFYASQFLEMKDNTGIETATRNTSCIKAIQFVLGMLNDNSWYRVYNLILLATLHIRFIKF
jgi:hypothetical protein